MVRRPRFGRLAFDQAPRQPIPGRTHVERMVLGTVLFARYSRSPPRQSFGLERLRCPERVRRVRALGAALRLGADLCGRSTELLLQTRLVVKGPALPLRLSPDASDLILGEQPRKRVAALGMALSLKTRLEAEAG